MCIVDNILHQQLGVENGIILGDHPASHGNDGPKDSDVEQDSTTWCDFEMSEQIGVDDGC